MGNDLVETEFVRRRILAWCPDAYVGPHLQTLQLIARIFVDLGHEVFFPFCDRLFPRCVAKESVLFPPGAAPEQGEMVCSPCISSFYHLMSGHGHIVFPLREAIPDTLRERVKDIIASVPDAELAALHYDGVAFGKICMHDLFLSYKLLLDERLEARDYLYLRESLETTLSTYAGLVETLPRTGFTDVYMYGQYAINMAVYLAAKKAGIGARIVVSTNHLGVDRRRVTVQPAQWLQLTTELVAAWPQWRSKPISAANIREIGDDILARLGSFGAPTYSPAKTGDTDLYAQLNLARNRCVIAVFTSSLDEYQAEDMLNEAVGYTPPPRKSRPFQSQIEWLSFLIEEVAVREDRQLVIRIHPREDSNKRDPVRSRHLLRLQESLAHLPENVRVIWPADPVSSYDLVEIADQVQVWGSTIGLESARLGLTVLKLNSGHPSYPEGDFAFSAHDAASYRQLMDDSLNWPYDLGRAIHAWRFYAYSRFFGTIDLTDVVADSTMASLPDYTRPAHAERLAEAFFSPAWAWDINREADQSREAPSATEEAEAIRRQFGRILHFTMTGENNNDVVPRRFDGAMANMSADSPDGSFAEQGDWCAYAWRGQLFQRRSLACRRFAALAF